MCLNFNIVLCRCRIEDVKIPCKVDIILFILVRKFLILLNTELLQLLDSGLQVLYQLVHGLLLLVPFRLPHNSLHCGFISLPELLIVCVLGVAEVGGAPHHNWNTTASKYYSPG